MDPNQISDELLATPHRSIHVFQDLGFPIDILNEPGRGRYAIASRNVVKGEIILRSRPYGAGKRLTVRNFRTPIFPALLTMVRMVHTGAAVLTNHHNFIF